MFMLGSSELHSEVVYLFEFGVPALVLAALVALHELQGRAAVGSRRYRVGHRRRRTSRRRARSRCGSRRPGLAGSRR